MQPALSQSPAAPAAPSPVGAVSGSFARAVSSAPEPTIREDVPADAVADRPKLVRWAWLAAGWTLFAVGVVGVVVPGLPTTGPMLLALACFSRGSTRLRNWLFHHPRFGPPLQRWKEHGTIPRRAKVTALAMMTASLAGILAFSSLPPWGKAGVAAFIAVGMVVVGRLPTADRTPSGGRASDPAA